MVQLSAFRLQQASIFRSFFFLFIFFFFFCLLTRSTKRSMLYLIMMKRTASGWQSGKEEMTIIIQIHGLKKEQELEASEVGIGMSACWCNNASRKSKSHVWFWNGWRWGASSMEVKDRPNPHHLCRRKMQARRGAFYPLSSACNLLGEKQEWIPAVDLSRQSDHSCCVYVITILSALVSWNRKEIC